MVTPNVAAGHCAPGCMPGCKVNSHYQASISQPSGFVVALPAACHLFELEASSLRFHRANPLASGLSHASGLLAVAQNLSRDAHVHQPDTFDP